MIKDQRRHRYIWFQVRSFGNGFLPTETEFLQELRKQGRLLYHKELKEMGCWLIRFQTTSGVIKCHYRETEALKTLLRSLHTLGSRPVEVTPTKTSGTIRGVTRTRR